MYRLNSRTFIDIEPPNHRFYFHFCLALISDFYVVALIWYNWLPHFSLRKIDYRIELQLTLTKLKYVCFIEKASKFGKPIKIIWRMGLKAEERRECDKTGQWMYEQKFGHSNTYYAHAPVEIVVMPYHIVLMIDWRFEQHESHRPVCFGACMFVIVVSLCSVGIDFQFISLLVHRFRIGNVKRLVKFVIHEIKNLTSA